MKYSCPRKCKTVADCDLSCKENKVKLTSDVILDVKAVETKKSVDSGSSKG